MKARLTGTQKFYSDIRKFAQKVPEKASLVRKKIAFDLHADIKERSPVDKGTFKGSWRIGIDSIDSSVNEKGDPTDHTGTQVAKLSTADQDSKIYITNSLPYAIRLERGHSQQAPVGMVRLAIVDAHTTLQEVMKQI